jgi:hypothetical protein
VSRERARPARPVFVFSVWDLDRHQANGTQGRLISWSPEKPDKDKKALLASHPDLTARFVKEASVNKQELVADVDFIDVAVRQENLTTIPGVPVMVQMPLQPSYGLTIHKTQALSTVNGPNANCAPVFGTRIVARARQSNRDSCSIPQDQAYRAGST